MAAKSREDACVECREGSAVFSWTRIMTLTDALRLFIIDPVTVTCQLSIVPRLNAGPATCYDPIAT